MASVSGKIATNTLFQVVGKAGSTALGVLTTILLTWYLGPVGFGTLTFILVFVTLFGALADWGVSLITVREASRDLNSAGKIIGNVVIVRLCLAMVAGIVSVGVIWLLPNYDFQTRYLTSIASFYLLILSLKTSFQIIFNVKMKMHNWSISELCSSVLTVSLILLVVLFKADILQVILAYMAGDLLAAGVAFYLGRRILPLELRIVSDKTKYLLLEAIPMGAILVVFTIYNRIDTVLLSFYQGNTAVGYYGLAYKIFEVLVLGAAYFANSILPIISDLAISNRPRLGEVYRKSFVILLLMGVGVAVLAFLFAPLLPFVFTKFGPSVIALQILSLALVVSYLNHLNGYTLIALGRQWDSFLIAIAALIVNVTLNFLLIPHFSFVAAAFVTFLTEGLIVLLSLVVIKKQLGIIPSVSDLFKVTKEIFIKRGQIF